VGDAASSSALHAVILAGGSGSRFWPLSRELSPKQLLSIFGGVSLMTRTVQRIVPFCRPEAVHVVTGERLLDELRNHLTAQPVLATVQTDYIVEPSARNTAAAIALAAAVVCKHDPDALLIVLPSDHLLEDGTLWEDTVNSAVAAAREGWLVTIGLCPRRPETGYGYIRAGDPLPDLGDLPAPPRKVAQFVEKPDVATAERFVASGDYLWNSGMLVARCSVVLHALEQAGDEARTSDSAAGREIADAVRWMADQPREDWGSDEVREHYDSLPSVPFDKAVLEVSERVAVVPAELDWSDVGSLLSIEHLGEADEQGNVLVGRFVDIDSTGLLGYSQDRLVATLGLHDLMVVDTSDATLIAPKDRAQDVRLLVEALKAAGADEVVSSKSSVRPWGSWTMLMKAEGFQIKSIDVNPGHRLSLQSHMHRSEHWIVISGTATVQRGDETVELHPNESIYLKMGDVHRLENHGKVPLKVIEVAVGEYLGEDDIVRYADDWNR